MSWSAHVSDLPPADVEDKLTDEIDRYFAQYEPESHASLTESKAAAAAAIRAAVDILDAGVVGTRNVNVSISGHANPNHEPAEGWSNDGITVTITQR